MMSTKNLLISFLLLFDFTSALFNPKISSYTFTGPPELIYFEDTSHIVYLDTGSGDLFFSNDDGAHFSQIDTQGTRIKSIILHPFKRNHAYAISDNLTHFKTVSSGLTWKKFTTPEEPAFDSIPSLNNRNDPLRFHSKRSEFAIFAGRCLNGDSSDSDVLCERQYYYTKDNFGTLENLTKAHDCLFSYSVPQIDARQADNLVTCILDGGEGTSLTLARSTDWFGTKSFVSYNGGLVTDISKIGASSYYLIAIGTHLSDRTTNIVYVSFNGYDWEKVDFPADTVLSNGFNIEEISGSSIFVDVAYPNFTSVGQLFASVGLNGSYFTKSLDYTHRDENGHVDFEVVDGIDGIVLANVVENGKDVISGGSKMVLRSKRSFDQGATWDYLKTESGEELNLHSIVQRASKHPESSGKYYSFPVPGVLLGIGDTDVSLKPYAICDTYISRDAGLTWSKILNGPHLFELGNQGSIIVAVEDEADVDTIKFSTDQGQTWQQVSLGETIKIESLTTAPDSTTFKFFVVGRCSSGQYKTYSLNFDGLYDRKCSESDFEDWFVKAPGSNKPLCFMGHEQKFQRRIRDANCFVGNEYKKPISIGNDCPCTESDYVCAYNFHRDANGRCIPAIKGLTPEEMESKLCVNNAQTYFEQEAYTLRPGTSCSVSKGVNMNAKIERKCPNYLKETSNDDHKLIDYDEDDIPDETEPDTNPDEREGDIEKSKEGINDGRVKTSSFVFDGEITKYVYLDRVEGSNLKDETIVLLTDHNKAYVTHDQGSSWELIAPDEEILDLIVNPHNTNHIYLLSTNQKIIYSTDRADNWKYFRTPATFIPGVQSLQFHPKHSNWLIYIGQLGCDNMSHQGSCRTVTYYSKSYGKRFAKLQEHVKTCQFIGHLLEPTDEQLIICEREDNEHTELTSELLLTNDFFENSRTLFDEVVGFAQVEGYLVTATAEGGGFLKIHVSVDGENWIDAHFPSNFKVSKNQAYTVLSAASHAVFLHITTNARVGTEFGAILKSNSIGSSYVVSALNVNRDSAGYVDFEQMCGLEGVAVINTVNNFDDARRGSKKVLKSMITHNDGADWDYLQPPSVDSKGKKYDCIGKSLRDCSLNLHGYTERADSRDTFSSGSAIGMMIGVGNVGEKLGAYLDGSTFLTRDGGMTWKEVKKGVYQWEYGDQGSIIVLVNGQDSTNTISYSLNEGQTWTDYQFTEELVKVNDISTVPSDDSKKFLLFTKLPSNKGDKSTVYQIDFSQLLRRKCSLDLNSPDTDDFDLWTPKHPQQGDNCLFGHEAQYYRKIPGKDCYIGEKLSEPYQVLRNCSCNRKDFECDWNYQRDGNGECKLLSGHFPPDHSDACRKQGTDKYWLPTGYRRIPLSTCEGGEELDKVEALPCPGKGEEFEAHHKGSKGIVFFIIIMVPVLVLSGIVYLVYYYYVGRYGQITLEDEEVQYDETKTWKKLLSMFGFGVVRTVSLVAENMKKANDEIKSKVLRKTITLDDSNGTDVTYSVLSGTPYQTGINDDTLDQGDFTEAEDGTL